jgi:hypothetical protein
MVTTSIATVDSADISSVDPVNNSAQARIHPVSEQI